MTKLEWKSPHGRLYVDVKNEKGETVNWNFELPSPNTLMRRGWTRDSLKSGDHVKVAGAPARNFPDHRDRHFDQGRRRQALVHRHDPDLRARGGAEGLGLGHGPSPRGPSGGERADAAKCELRHTRPGRAISIIVGHRSI